MTHPGKDGQRGGWLLARHAPSLPEVHRSIAVPRGGPRKRWIGTLTQEPVAAGRVIGSVAAAIAGVGQGLQLVRVHDVKATRQALAIATASWSGQEPEPTLQKSTS